MATIKALVKPVMLRWAGSRAKVKPEDAAKAAGVPVERLQAWETENEENPDVPTLGQLRALAGKYHFPVRLLSAGTAAGFRAVAGFPQARAFRRRADSANLAYHIRSAYAAASWRSNCFRNSTTNRSGFR